MTAFATPDWAAQFASNLQGSAPVRTESMSWIFGPLLLVVDGDTEAGTPATALRLDLHEGSVRGVDVTSPDDASRVPFAIGGSVERWKSVFAEGGISLVDGVLDSKLRVKGDLPTLARHRALLDAVTAAGAQVGTAWPEAPAPAGR